MKTKQIIGWRDHNIHHEKQRQQAVAKELFGQIIMSAVMIVIILGIVISLTN